jgi:hypothetical protein
MKIFTTNTYKVKSFWSAVKADESQNENMKSKIHELDNKLQQMLLWSNTCTLLACIQMVFTVARIYSSFTGKHPILLISTLVVIILLFAAFLYFKWKSIAYKHNDLKKASKTYLNYHINKLNGQRKLISGYLLVYFVIIAVSGIFFCQDIHNGLTLLFKSTAPVMLVIYGLGFYFMTNFGRQKQKLEILEKQVDWLSKAERVVQN